MLGQLDGKVAWVVGAGGALGAAIAARFAREGASVTLSGRTAGSLERTAKKVREVSGADPSIIGVDSTDSAQVESAARAIVDRHSRVDILVNSVTCPIFGPFQCLSDEDWLAVLDAKLLGYMRTCRAVLPHMIRQGEGSIVNISGLGGHMPLASVHMPGSVANAGVNLLTKGLAQLHGRDGVRINSLAPGPILSPRLERIKAAEETTAAAGRGQGGAASLPPYAPPLGIGLPEHIADMALFLASTQSAYLTGGVIEADGGATTTL